MQIALFDKGRVRISREFVTMMTMMTIAILMMTNDKEIDDYHDHGHD